MTHHRTHTIIRLAGAALGLAMVLPTTAWAQDAQPAPAPAAVPATPAQAEEPVLNRTEREDGLVIEELRMGEGEEVTRGAVITAHYRGTLKETGAQFDASYDRGEPSTFALPGVIQGWQDGLVGMKVGGKRRLTIPSALAYGPEGRPPVIPPNADLVFVVELVDVLKADEVSKEVKAGNGPEAAPGTMVRLVTYAVGKTAEGRQPLGPFPLEVTSQIPQLYVTLAGMKQGGVRQITLPWSAVSPQPGLVPPEAEVTFLVELVEVATPQPLPAPAEAPATTTPTGE